MHLSYGYTSSADSQMSSFVGYCIGLIIGAVISGLICDKILANKGYEREENHGFLLGFFLGWIGVIICICKKNLYKEQMMKISYMNSNYPPQGQYNNTYHQPQQQSRTLFKGDAESNDGWTCVCGARNKDYEGTCHRCGKSKHEQKEARAAIQTAVDQRKITTSADDTAQQIKDYKKLLDDGLITEEEFTAKKRSILGI